MAEMPSAVRLVLLVSEDKSFFIAGYMYGVFVMLQDVSGPIKPLP